MRKRYTVVRAYSPNDLKLNVEELLSIGWELSGGVTIASSSAGGEVLVQALCLDEHELQVADVVP